jgi:hypothetical protein
MNINYQLIGRLTYAKNPDAALTLQREFTPTMKDFSLVPLICKLVEQAYPYLDESDTKTLIAATIYKLYSPASLLKARCSNAPAGMRIALSNALGYKNGSNINFYQERARAHVKNPRYLKKIESIAMLIKAGYLTK